MTRMSEQRDALAEVRKNLRREVGPSDVGDGNWQPMIAASEVWVLLDALDALEKKLADAEQRGAARVAAAVEVIHQSSEVARGVGQQRDGRWTPYCELDGESWPCDTIAALTHAAAQDPA